MGKVKAHFKTHVSIASHRNTAVMWANLNDRAMYAELGRLAIAKYAADTDNTFWLSSAEMMGVTCCKSPAASAQRIRSFISHCEAGAKQLGGYPPLTVELLSSGWRVTFRNLAKKQGFDREFGHLSEPPEAEAEANTEAEAKEDERDGAPAPTPWAQPFVQMLKGTIPTGLSDEKWESPYDWLGFHESLIAAEAELKCDGVTEGKAYTAAFKATMLRFWNNKAPPSRASPSKPSKQEIIDENLRKELEKYGETQPGNGRGGGEGSQGSGAIEPIPNDPARGQGVWKF